MKSLLTKLTISAGVVLSAATVSHPAMAASFEVTLEAPGVQQSTLSTNPNAYGAKNVVVDNFNSDQTGYNTTSLAFAGNSQIGSYNQGVIAAASQYGGAGGTGNYLTVQPGLFGTSSDIQKSTTTLTLNTPQRYFGLDWSAGDKYNELDFYSGTQLLEKFTTADVIDFIGKQSNAKDYYSNPNQQFQGQDSSEPFAFLNFFADPNNTSVTFDKIQFINNSSSTGFESDNHTVASDYVTISGKNISVPEPSAALGVLMIAGFGIFSQRRRISQKA